MSDQLVFAIIANAVALIFAAGVLWRTTTDIAERVKRIESWINGTRNEEGHRLKNK